MSDRAKLAFEATITKEEFDRQVAEMKQQLEDLKRDAENTEHTTDAIVMGGAQMVRDVALMAEVTARMMGVQLTTTQQIALDMIQMSAMSVQHAYSIITTAAPWMAPWYLSMLALSSYMQAQAIMDIQEKGSRARAQLAFMRSAINIGDNWL